MTSNISTGFEKITLTSKFVQYKGGKVGDASEGTGKITFDISSVPSGTKINSIKYYAEYTYGSGASGNVNYFKINSELHNLMTLIDVTSAKDGTSVILNFAYKTKTWPWNNPTVGGQLVSSYTRSCQITITSAYLIVDYLIPFSDYKLTKNTNVNKQILNYTLNLPSDSNTYKISGNIGTSLFMSLTSYSSGDSVSIVSLNTGLISGTSSNFTIIVKIYNNGTLISTQTLSADSSGDTLIATVPSSVKPEFSSISTTISNTRNSSFDNIIISGDSTVLIKTYYTCGDASSYSDILSFYINGTQYKDGITSSGSGSTRKFILTTTIKITSLNMNMLSIRAVDKRGRTSVTTSKSIGDIYSYSNPYITNLAYSRNDGTKDDSYNGTNLHITGAVGFSSLNSKNSISKILLTATTINSNNELETVLTKDLTSYSPSIEYISSGITFNINTKYNIALYVKDVYGGSTTYNFSISTAKIFMKWDPVNFSFGFGGYPLQSNEVHIGKEMTLHSDNSPKFDGKIQMLKSDGTYYDIDNTIDYTKLQNKPTIITSYNKLSDIPDLSVYAKTSDLSSIATSGSYSDLLNTPLTSLSVSSDYIEKTSIYNTDGGINLTSIVLKKGIYIISIRVVNIGMSSSTSDSYYSYLWFIPNSITSSNPTNGTLGDGHKYLVDIQNSFYKGNCSSCTKILNITEETTYDIRYYKNGTGTTLTTCSYLLLKIV